jgi:hypothetical protein
MPARWGRASRVGAMSMLCMRLCLCVACAAGEAFCRPVAEDCDGARAVKEPCARGLEWALKSNPGRRTRGRHEAGGSRAGPRANGGWPMGNRACMAQDHKSGSQRLGTSEQLNEAPKPTTPFGPHRVPRSNLGSPAQVPSEPPASSARRPFPRSRFPVRWPRPFVSLLDPSVN